MLPWRSAMALAEPSGGPPRGRGATPPARTAASWRRRRPQAGSGKGKLQPAAPAPSQVLDRVRELALPRRVDHLPRLLGQVDPHLLELALRPAPDLARVLVVLQ